MNTDPSSTPSTALERKIVRALRRLDVSGQAAALAIITALADGRIANAHTILAVHCAATKPSPEVRAA